MATGHPKLVHIQEKGQVTLPAEVRRRLGLKKGDLVGITETNEGILISPQQVVARAALDRMGSILREQGVDLEELIGAGREIRGDLLSEVYGVDAGERPD
ncbi:MAG: AbrB/MazE/SpoVT family DNA-binding domain-containing protein [Chloroflexota bacterium]